MKSQTIKRYLIKTIQRIFKNYVLKKATNMINLYSFLKLKANGLCWMNKIRKKIFLLCSFLIISVSMLSVVYWLYPQDQQPQLESTGQSSNTFNSADHSDNSGQAHASDAAFNSTSQMDTEVNCKLQFNASNEILMKSVRVFSAMLPKVFRHQSSSRFRNYGHVIWAIGNSWANCRWISLLRKVMAIFRQSSMQCMT